MKLFALAATSALAEKSADPTPWFISLEDEPQKFAEEPYTPYCLTKDINGELKAITEANFCDGVADCPEGEDEDGRLAICNQPTTESGCCAEIKVNWSGATCYALDTYRGKDRYFCREYYPNGVDFITRELRWEPYHGWFYTDFVGNWGYFAVGNWEHDAACIGEHGEFEDNYSWTGYNLALSCNDEAPAPRPAPCAHHTCPDNKMCSNNLDVEGGYECVKRDSVRDQSLKRINTIEGHIQRLYDSVTGTRAGDRFIFRMNKVLTWAKNSWTGESCHEGAAEDAEDVNVFSKDNMCKLNGQINSALNSWARNFACSGDKDYSRKIIKAARKNRNFFDAKNDC